MAENWALRAIFGAHIDRYIPAELAYQFCVDISHIADYTLRCDI